jgi:hypothetical protein
MGCGIVLSGRAWILALVPVLIHVPHISYETCLLWPRCRRDIVTTRTANSGGNHGGFFTMSTFLIQKSSF